MVRTSGFHPGNRGSIPLRATIALNARPNRKKATLNVATKKRLFKASFLFLDKENERREVMSVESDGGYLYRQQTTNNEQQTTNSHHNRHRSHGDQESADRGFEGEFFREEKGGHEDDKDDAEPIDGRDFVRGSVFERKEVEQPGERTEDRGNNNGENGIFIK